MKRNKPRKEKRSTRRCFEEKRSNRRVVPEPRPALKEISLNKSQKLGGIKGE